MASCTQNMSAIDSQLTVPNLILPRGHDSRSLNVAESRPLHFKVPVSLLCGITNLAANVLALSITIRPDDEVSGAPRLGFDVLGNSFAVLFRGSTTGTNDPGASIPDETHAGDDCANRGIEEAVWRRVTPVLEVAGKLDAREVASDGRHGDRAPAQRRAEIVVEVIVLGVGVAGVALGRVLAMIPTHGDLEVYVPH